MVITRLLVSKEKGKLVDNDFLFCDEDVKISSWWEWQRVKFDQSG